MKKSLLIITALLLAALFAVSLAACNPVNEQEEGPNKYEDRVYTVTFDTDCNLVLKNKTVQVKYGEKVARPEVDLTNAKTGYTFKWWAKSTDTGTEYNFDQPVTANMTLKAQYQANNYYHNVLLAAGLEWNSDGTYTVNKTKHIQKDAENRPLYVKQIADNGEITTTTDADEALKDGAGEAIGYAGPSAVADGETAAGGMVILSDSSAKGRLYSTYASQQPFLSTATFIDEGNLSTPSKQSEDNPFMFWAYLEKVGEKYEPVRLTYLHYSGEDKTKTSITIQLLEKYYKTTGLDLIPIFKDDLPKIKVSYVDSDRSNEFRSTEITVTDKISAEDKYTPDTSLTQHDGEEFDHWYYRAVAKDNDGKILYQKGEGTTTDASEADLDNNGNPIYVTEEKEFIFAEDGATATVPFEVAFYDVDISIATPNGKLLDGNYFIGNAELKLYAKWRKLYKIADKAGFDKLYDDIQAAAAKTESNEETADEDWEDLCNAHIYFTGIVDLTGGEYTQLFDSKHPFKGKIDGLYTEGDLSKRATIKGGTFASAVDSSTDRYASIFGYNSGKIINLIVEDVTVVATEDASAVYIGTIASVNNGLIENCSVVYTDTLALGYAGKPVVFGGIAAISRGSSEKDTGIIRSCSFTATVTAECSALTFGGIVGENANPSTVERGYTNITISALSGITDKAFVGGIAGVNRGQLRRILREQADGAEYNGTVFTVNSVCHGAAIYLGGLVGRNLGSINRSYVEVHFGAEDTPLTVGSKVNVEDAYANVAIGGLSGNNEGYFKDCYSTGDIFVNIKKADGDMQASIGGLVGANYSGRIITGSTSQTTVGSINYCYSLVDLTVNVESDVTGVVNVGGLIGRNKYTYLKSNFVRADIVIVITAPESAAIVYGGETTGNEAGASDAAALTVNYGHLYGKQDAYDKENVTAPKGSYEEGKLLTVNGNAPGSDVQPNGTARSAEFFGDVKNLIGSGSELEFNDNYWDFSEEDQSLQLTVTIKDDFDYEEPKPDDSETEDGETGDGETDDNTGTGDSNTGDSDTDSDNGSDEGNN